MYRSKKEKDRITKAAVKLLTIHPRDDGGFNLPSINELNDIVAKAEADKVEPEVIRVAQSIYKDIMERIKVLGNQFGT